MKFQRTLTAIAALSGLFGATAALAQVANGTAGNLVVNGSMQFNEAVSQGSDNTVGASPHALAGWTFVNTDPTAEYWDSFQSQASADGGSYLGIQDLDTFKPRVNAQGITQTITGLQVGATYELTFLSMSNHDSAAGATQDWDVSFGTQSQASVATLPNADQTGNWVQSTMTFQATSASQALTFIAQYMPGSNPEMLNLDGVVLEKVSSVPEPSSWALLLAGLGVATLVARRRRAR